MEWVALVILIFVEICIFMPEMLLTPVWYAFAGMMEPCKSRRLVSHGIALALFGPPLFVVLLLLGGILQSLGGTWPARGCGITALALFPALVIAGVVLGFRKARYDDAQQLTCEKPKAN